MLKGISRRAQIGYNNIIDPGVIIGPDVVIGDDNKFCAGAVIIGPSQLGNGNYIGHGTIVGTPSRQRLRTYQAKLPVEANPGVHIGHNNLIFEHVTVHTGLYRPTKIGTHVAIGAHSHIAHDSLVRDDCIVAPSVAIGGYSILGYGANLGLGVLLHHRTTIGAYAMCGMGAVVTRNVRPGVTVVGNPARYLQVNMLGLQRGGLASFEIEQIRLFVDKGQLPKSKRVRGFIEVFMRDILETTREKRHENLL